MTIIHPTLILSHLDHLDLVWSMSPSKGGVLLLFFSQFFTVLRSTLNVLVNPRRLLRSWYALKISSLRSSVYPFGAGFSRLCRLHDLQRYFCFPFNAWPFRTKASLPQYGQQIVTVTMITLLLRWMIRVCFPMVLGFYPILLPVSPTTTFWTPETCFSCPPVRATNAKVSAPYTRSPNELPLSYVWRG